MKFESGVCLAILVVFGLFTESECGRRHRHRHRHHHLTTTEENSETEVVSTTENQFVAAFRSNQSDSEESTATPNNLQSRLASLEQYVRYLCLEDEEDVDRRIRHLGIKCICPKTEAPVCGSDDVTYYNRCFLQCRAQQALLSYHRYRITLKKFGAC